MTWETKLERDALADDRDRLWGAWPAGCGEVETNMSENLNLKYDMPLQVNGDDVHDFRPGRAARGREEGRPEMSDILKPGVYANMDFPTYRTLPAVNWHTLWRLLEESPAHARDEVANGTRETECMAFGNLTDFILLEPKRFQEQAVVEPEIKEGGAPRRPNARQITAKKPSPETVAAIEFWGQWDAANAGKIVVTKADYDDVMRIAAQVREAQCTDYITGGRQQVVLVWGDPTTGLLCKARLDYERYAGFFNHYITDLKTAKSAKAGRFAAQVFNLGYDGQMAFYHDGWAILHSGETSLCWWLVAEKHGPRIVKPWQCTEDWLDAGRLLYREGLARWNECLKSNTWPDYGGPEGLEMPGWAKEKRGVGPDRIVAPPKYTGGGVPEGQTLDEFDEFLKEE